MSEVLTAPRVMTGDQTVTDGALVIGEDVLDWVGPAWALPAEYAALPRTDYPGSTIMPGLIDSHVHLAFDGGPNPAARMRSETDEQQLVLMLHSARDLLGVGVTTARDLGARAYLDVVVRDAVAAGLARGPRMVVATRPITVTGGHCWFMGGEADSDDELRRLAPGFDADVIVVDGDPSTDIAALGKLQRVIARGRDYLPDSGRFDVSAPGTPFASPDHVVDLRLLTEATKRRQA